VPVSLSALQTRGIVLDIEGTTTPIEFVYQRLFPYARRRVAAFLARQGSSEAVRAAIEQLREERAADMARGEADLPVFADFGPAEITAYVGRLMDRDRKSPGLKALQGLIWQEGFASGDLKGEVYPDVRPAFERWQASGRTLSIYSSGSVLAQRLLFGASNAGDLTGFLDGYFDTAVGPKTSPDSYRSIAERIGLAPRTILFVSDVASELDAARTAGMQTALCVRGPQALKDGGPHPIVSTFDDFIE
jgi:enolase-phosphatase E1